MSIKTRIRSWLGITEIQEDQAMLYEYIKAMDWKVNANIANRNKQLDIILPGLGRIIAKLDPTYGKPEIDPARKAESDRIGNEAISRLEADMMARKHTLGEL